MVSAGEASGDIHAAHALHALSQQGQPYTAFGMGADSLDAAGVELVVDCRDLAVIGIVDVLKNYGKFRQRLAALRRAMTERRPDILFLVDFPDFNLKLAETAKSLGIPVLFYVSPQVWAWRAGRVPRIASLVDHMAVLFPFEVDIYRNADLDCTHVGHPLVDEVSSSLTRESACERLRLDPQQPVIALLPGSRPGEIERMLQPMLETAEYVQRSEPGCQFVLPVAATLNKQKIQQAVDSSAAPVLLTRDATFDTVRAADTALVASGTATLEVALLGTPMVILYRVQALNYAIMKRLIRIPHIGLVNIVAGREVVPEFIQHEAVPQAMATELLKQLRDDIYRQRMLEDVAKVAKALGEPGASTRVANLITEVAKVTKHE